MVKRGPGRPVAPLPRLLGCKIEGCDQKVWRREMCRPHYDRNRLYGEPEKLQPSNIVPQKFGGRPKGSRDRLTTEFIQAMADDFTTHGRAAIRRCREDDVTSYLKLAAHLIPKEIDLGDKTLEAILGPLATNDLDALQLAIGEAIAASNDDRAGEGAAGADRLAVS